MNDAPQATTQAPPAEPDASGWAWLLRMWARTRLGHEAVMLDRVQRTQRISEVVARNTMTGNMKDTTGYPDGSEGDGMGVDIGDSVVHNHYYATPDQGDPPLPDIPTTKPAGILAKLALAGVLLSTGAAGGLGIPWALRLFDKPPPADTTDQDTKYVGGIRVE